MPYRCLFILFFFLNLNSFSQNTSRCFNGQYASGQEIIDFTAELNQAKSKRYTHTIHFNYYIRGIEGEQARPMFYCKQVDSVFYFAKDSTYFNLRKKQARFQEDSNFLITDVSYLFYQPDSTKVLMEDITFLVSCGDNKNVDMADEEIVWDSPEEHLPERIEDRICDFCEKEASFTGGPLALLNFLASTIIYPESCVEMGVQGTVYVQFIVEKDGTLSQPIVLKGAHVLLDKEALRVVKIMPAWIPAEEAGKIVRSRYTLPINFRIE